MIQKMLLMTSLLMASFAFAEGSDSSIPVCGGIANGKTMEFKLNPLSKFYSGYSEGERLMVFIDLNDEKYVKVVYGETITEEEWEGLKELREKSQSQETYNLITRLATGKVTQVWVGWTQDGYIHFESGQKDYSFTFSCQR